MLDPLLAHLPPRLARWVPQFQAAHLCYGVSPILLAAIMDRESLGGNSLIPNGPEGKGDKSRGFGLMQIDIGSHRSFLEAKFDDGKPLWMDPTQNVLYGARLLKRNLDALKGNLRGAIAAYNAGLARVTRIVRSLPFNVSPDEMERAVDAATTNRNYVNDVLARMERFTHPEIPNA